MTLNIPQIEVDKVKQGTPFYTIRPILKKKWDKSKIADKTIKQKGNEVQFKILQYSVFENLETLFHFFDYKQFRVGNSIDEVVKFYKNLYGKTIIKNNWVLLVFKLRQL